MFHFHLIGQFRSVFRRKKAYEVVHWKRLIEYNTLSLRSSLSFFLFFFACLFYLFSRIFFFSLILSAPASAILVLYFTEKKNVRGGGLGNTSRI